MQLEGTRQSDMVKINAYIAVRMQETHLLQVRTYKLILAPRLRKEVLALTEG